MKKIILLISALAIVALAVFNLNLNFNKESKIGVVLKSPLTVAKNENGVGGVCKTVVTIKRFGCWTLWELWCSGGSEPSCQDGWELAEECEPYRMDWDINTYTCPGTPPINVK